jgi:HAD superfamily hydrolase (TIGR01549 family)
MVKLVAFDLWKTLAKKQFSTAEKIREEFCPRSSLRPRYFLKLFEEATQTTRWNTREEMADSILRRLGAEPSERNIARVIDIMDGAEGNFELLPHAIQMLKSLKVRGYVTGIVSNTNVFSVEHLKEKSELLRHVDFPVFSFDVGAIKPDKAIFAELLNRSGCDPWDAVMVGDKEEDDILPAREIGMKALLFTDYGRLKAGLEGLGVHLRFCFDTHSFKHLKQ